MIAGITISNQLEGTSHWRDPSKRLSDSFASTAGMASSEEDEIQQLGRRSAPVRSNSMGAIGSLSKLQRKTSNMSDVNTAGAAGEKQRQQHLAGLLKKLHLPGGSRRHTMAFNSNNDALDTSNHKHLRRAPEKFHHRCFMDDSISVQKRHKNVLDDEKHEENPHLDDFLHPHHFVHVEGKQSVLHTETRLLRVQPAAVTAEESDSDDDDVLAALDEDKAIHPQVEGGKVKKDDVVLDVERVEVEDAPKTAVAHKTLDKPLRSCMKLPWGQDPEPRKPKKNVFFHEVTVRDYDITLGDHPNVSYGPPVSLSWDYLEYDPLQIDEYEIHHAKRRNMRQMMLNYYRRRNILLLRGDFDEEELRAAWKDVKKIKRQRYITKYFLPVRFVEDAGESAVRKIKRRIPGKSGVKAEQRSQ